MENIRVSKCVHYDGPHVNLLHIMMHWSAAYIQYMEYVLSVSCIHSVCEVLPIGQLHIFCRWHTSYQWAAHIQYTEYFPSVSCIHSVHGILPIGQLHTFCAQNTSHWSAAYVLHTAYFPSVSCIHSVNRILPFLFCLICTTQKNISLRITEKWYREGLTQFTKALTYKWDVTIAYYP